MKTPPFWYGKNQDTPPSHLLLISKIYGCVVEYFINRKPRYHSTLPVICVGNINMGGTGKTPVAQSIARLLVNSGKNPVILLRGYGGKIKKPTRVDLSIHTAADVGDEALLHAHGFPTYISPNRVAGAKMIEMNGGFDAIIMDDGFQNSSLDKTLSLVVVDGIKGFGNKLVFPAGPLRESIENGLARADALIVMGNDSQHFAQTYKKKLPVLKALFTFNAVDIEKMKNKRISAFAGIGHPDKFFTSLTAAGFKIVRKFSFADHRIYTSADIKMLKDTSKKYNLPLITTMKDYIRLSKDDREDITPIDGTILWENGKALISLLRDKGIIK